MIICISVTANVVPGLEITTTVSPVFRSVVLAFNGLPASKRVTIVEEESLATKVSLEGVSKVMVLPMAVTLPKVNLRISSDGGAITKSLLAVIVFWLSTSPITRMKSPTFKSLSVPSRLFLSLMVLSVVTKA